MTREEAIAILESYKSFEDNRTEDMLHHGYDNTKEAKKRKKALDMAIKALSENKGEWIFTEEKVVDDETDEGFVYTTKYRRKCSVCGGDYGYTRHPIKPKDENFCKYCGADMRGGKE